MNGELRTQQSLALEKIKPAALQAAQPPAVNPMTLLKMAMDQNCDIEKLTKLMDLADRWEKTEARKQFDAAMAAFKANPPELHKNKRVLFTSQKGTTDYKHATLDEVAINIGAAMSSLGLSFRWNVEQVSGRIRVTCILTHSAGHFEQVQMEGSADATGNKNEIQQVGSTVTYLQRYTLLAITGMAVKDQDNDGNGGVLLTGEMQDLLDIIKGSASRGELQAAFAEAYKTAKDNKTKVIFMDAYEARKKEIA